MKPLSLDKRVQAIVSDYGRWSQIGGLRACLAEAAEPLSDLEWDGFVHGIADDLTSQLRVFAYSIYQLMCVSNDWTDAGREACESAFGRCELGLTPQAPWGYQEKGRFLSLAADFLDKFELKYVSQDDLKKRVDEMTIEILGLQFTIHDFTSLNRLLLFVGVPLILQGGVYGPYREFILGKGTFGLMGDYRVFVLEREVLRSPTTIMPMAAVIGEREIFVRDEAMAAVFQMKWASFLPYAFNGAFDYYGIEHRLSAMIRRRVFECYGVRTTADLEVVTESFIFDLKETVLNHELGHGVIQYHLLSPDVAPIAEASKMCGESVVTALLEVLADFAPWLGDVKGPLQNMVDVSLTDYDRAERMFWMYLSDVWFFDTPDEYMYLYSELMTSVMISAVGNDGNVDFSRLDLAINADDGILNLALSQVTLGVAKLKTVAEAAEFDCDGETVNFDNFCQFVLDEDAASQPDQLSFAEVFATDEMREYSTMSLIWMKVFETLMADDRYQPVLLGILDDVTRDVKRHFLEYLGEDGGLPLREVIFKRLDLVFS